MNVCVEQLGGMYALFSKILLGIEKSVISLFILVLSEYRHEIPGTLSFKSRDSPP